MGWAGVASAPGRARPGRRRAPACAHRAEAEGRHPLPGLGGGPRQARGRELGRRAPAGWRVTRSSPFPLSLPVADAAAPAAPRAEDWTAEPRAAAAAERTPDAVTPCPGAGARASLVGAAPALLLPPFSPPSPPLPAPRPRTRRTSSGDGAGGGAGLPLLPAPSSSGLWSDLSNFPFRRQRGPPPPPPPPSPPPPPLPPPPPALLPPRASLARPPSSLRTFGDRGGARSGGDAESRGAAASCGRPLSGGEAESRPAWPPRGPAAPPSLSSARQRRRRRRRQWQSPEEHHAEEEAAGAPARSRYERLPLPPLLRLLFLSSPRVSSRRRPRSLPGSLPLLPRPRRLTPGRQARSPLSCLVRAPASRTGAPRTPRCALPPSLSHPLREPRSLAAT